MHDPTPTPSRRIRYGASAALTAAITVALVIPPAAAQAADVVSQGTGRLIETSLLGSDILESVVALQGAAAVNADATGDVTVDQPLDASAIAGLLGLAAGSTNLFGDNGIVRLGAVGQYAQARDDGSSSAFSGAVSAAPSMIGIGTVTPSSVGSPEAGDTATIRLGSSDSLVGVEVRVGALAASAQQAADGTQTGQYLLADAGVTVDGTLLGGALSIINPALDTLIGLANVSGAGLTNPFASGTIELTLDDLLAAAGVSDINALPAGTDLLSFVPVAVATQITDRVTGVLDAALALGDRLQDNPFTFLAGVALETAVGTARAVIVPVLDGLTDQVIAPLGTALTQLAQLQVNLQSSGADGSFTQTALRIGVGPGGSLASVDLANATVGPNAGQLAVPVAGPESLAIAGGFLAVAGVVFGAFMLRRRTQAPLVTGRN